MTPRVTTDYDFETALETVAWQARHTDPELLARMVADLHERSR